nr:serine--tRNA ligase [Candidatus Omnitrophota bacterium]
MLDVKFIREHKEVVKEALAKRKSALDIEQVMLLDDQRRQVLSELEGLRAAKNKANDEIS